MPMNRERAVGRCCWNRFGASSAGGLDNLAVMVGFHKDAVAAAAEKARREYDRTRAILLVANLLLLLLISGVLVVSLASGIVGPLEGIHPGYRQCGRW